MNFTFFIIKNVKIETQNQFETKLNANLYRQIQNNRTRSISFQKYILEFYQFFYKSSNYEFLIFIKVLKITSNKNYCNYVRF